MVSAANLRTGLVIEREGELYQVVEFQHVKPGKGGAFVRTKLKNLRTSRVIDKTFDAEQKIQEVRLEEKELQYLYREGGHYFFMDNQTYEQIPLSAVNLGDSLHFLKENMTVTAIFYQEELISVELPTFVELRVMETGPAFKGDTVTSTYKPAKMETGVVIQVPLFINEGDVIRIDTRKGVYLERV
jgi:elongation factor P